MNKHKISYTAAIKVSILLGWLILICLLIKRDVIIARVDLRAKETLLQAGTEEYQSIYFRKSKIGYVSTTFNEKADSSFLLLQNAQMNLNIGNSTQKILLHLEATLSQNNVLKNFIFNFTSPFYKMEASGHVKGNTVTYQLNTAANSIQNQFTFTSPPLLATTRRSYLLTGKLEKGKKIKIPWFDPVSLTGKESILEYRGIEAELINGRVQNLHRFIETFSGVKVNSWLNDDGLVVKEESPAGFVFLREPKFKALSMPGDSKEILSQVAVQLAGEMVNPENKTIEYRLQLPEGVPFDLNSDYQKIEGNLLSVTRPTLEGNPGPAQCIDSQPNLAASPYIQTDHKEIRELSQKIAGKSQDLQIRAENIGVWVYSHLEKQSVIGLPDALTTLRSRKGDCNEHAVLFAALARSAGIPTRIVAGVTFHKKSFYYHAWNEVCLGQKWVAIDTTTNQFPADATHLRFVEGEIQEQVRVGALLGQLTIEPLSQNDKRFPSESQRIDSGTR